MLATIECFNSGYCYALGRLLRNGHDSLYIVADFDWATVIVMKAIKRIVLVWCV